MKRVTAAAIVAAVSMAFAGQASATTPERLSEAQLDAVVAGTAPDHDRHHGYNKHGGKSDHGDKHYGKHDRGDRHHGKNDHGDKHHGKRDHGDKHYGKNDHGDRHHGGHKQHKQYGKFDRGDRHGKPDHGKHYGRSDHGKSHKDATLIRTGGILNGNKVLSGNDVNVLSGNNTAVGVGILGTGAIALRK